jgi:hypothetical protein
MRAREARNRRLNNKSVAEAISSKSHTRPSDELGLAILEVIRDLRATKVDGDGERNVVGGIDSDSELPGLKYAFPRPTRSSWRPPIQLRKGDGHTAITTSSLDFTIWTTCKKPSNSLLSLTSYAPVLLACLLAV